MQKWEYCAIAGFRRGNTRKLEPHQPALWRFTLDGLQVTEIKGKEEHEIARIIAQLGEDGWEAFATGSTGGGGGSNLQQTTHVLYFKRPKQ